MLSTPLATDFGPDPDGAVGGTDLDAKFALGESGRGRVGLDDLSGQGGG